MPEDDHLLITVRCRSCGATWPVAEDVPGTPERVTKTDTYRCANCGAAAVFEAGVQKIERREG